MGIPSGDSTSSILDYDSAHLKGSLLKWKWILEDFARDQQDCDLPLLILQIKTLVKKINESDFHYF